MPHTRAAKRYLRKSRKLRLHNRAVLSATRGQIKSIRQAIASKSSDLPQQLAGAASRLDRAAQSGIIHPNKAARLKSRLARAAQRAIAAKT
ncbi:MAG: 30S ribosomal protein S20 [Planctomycetes bacterium]|nr:30S ribosomal protein S20 [Planctomycetota bacterium]